MHEVDEKELAPVGALNPDKIDFSKDFEDEATLAQKLNAEKKAS